MNKIIFSGYVHPQRAKVSVPAVTQDIEIAGSDRSIGLFTVEIENSQITAILETKNTSIDVETWRNSLQSRIEILVDTYGFLNGGGYEVEIVKVINVNVNEVTVYPTHFENYQQVNSNKEFIDKFALIYKISQHESGVYFQKSLAELRKAVRYPFESPFHAYRSIEFLRQIYGDRNNLDPQKKRLEAWTILREDLDIDKKLISENIKFFSDPIRHGEIRGFDEVDRVRMLKTAWKIVNLFIERENIRLTNER